MNEEQVKLLIANFAITLGANYERAFQIADQIQSEYLGQYLTARQMGDRIRELAAPEFIRIAQGTD